TRPTASSKVSRTRPIRSMSACSGTPRTWRGRSRRRRCSARSSKRRASTRNKRGKPRRKCHRSPPRDRNSLFGVVVGVPEMRRILLFATAMLVAGQAFAGWVTSVDAAQKKAKTAHRLIFVDLFADWCGWCHRFEEEVIPSQAFQSATDDMILLRLNTEDGKDGTKLARDYGIRSLPTFVVLDEDLLIAGQIRGYAPAGDFARMLK